MTKSPVSAMMNVLRLSFELGVRQVRRDRTNARDAAQDVTHFGSDPSLSVRIQEIKIVLCNRPYD